MKISTANPSDLNQIAKLLKSFYLTHNLFNESESKIANYLMTESTKHKLLISKDTNQVVVACAFIVKTGESSDTKHTRWKFRHLAYRDETSAKQILQACEDLTKLQSKTQKIELTIAENEKSLSFLEVCGYKHEGTLSNHYRLGETCFVLSKNF